MIKFCYLFEVNVPGMTDFSSLFIKSNSQRYEINKGQFKDISSCYSSEITIELPLKIDDLLKSSPCIPCNYNKNEIISINLNSSNSISSGSVKLFFSMLPKSIFEVILAQSAETMKIIEILKLTLNETQEKLEKFENHERINNKKIYLQDENLKFDENFNILKKKINENEIELEEYRKDNQNLLSENLDLHNEICELHQKIINLEKKNKEKDEASLINIVHKHAEAITKLRNLEFSYQELQLQNNSLTNKLEYQTEELKFYKSGSSADSQESILDFDKIRDLLNKQNNFQVTDNRQSAVKIPQIKLKEEQKGKQSLNERFQENLKKFGVENDFERLGDNLYAYGNKRITVSSRGELIIVRVGGGFMCVEEFLKGVAGKTLDFEEKVMSAQATPTKLLNRLSKFSTLSTDTNLLKENLNTPSPKVTRSNLKFLTTGKKPPNHLGSLSKVGRLLYK